jgi:gamma-glutamyltranspeptidase
VIQKDLAATLREIGAKGSAAFYQGRSPRSSPPT